MARIAACRVLDSQPRKPRIHTPQSRPRYSSMSRRHRHRHQTKHYRAWPATATPSPKTSAGPSRTPSAICERPTPPSTSRPSLPCRRATQDRLQTSRPHGGHRPIPPTTRPAPTSPRPAAKPASSPRYEAGLPPKTMRSGNSERQWHNRKPRSSCSTDNLIRTLPRRHAEPGTPASHQGHGHRLPGGWISDPPIGPFNGGIPVDLTWSQPPRWRLGPGAGRNGDIDWRDLLNQALALASRHCRRPSYAPPAQRNPVHSRPSRAPRSR